MTRHGADKFLLRYSLLRRNWGKIWFSMIYIHTGTLIPGLLFLLDRWNTKLFITCTINIMSHYHKWQFITKATQDLYTVLTHLVAARCLDLSLSSHQSCRSCCSILLRVPVLQERLNCEEHVIFIPEQKDDCERLETAPSHLQVAPPADHGLVQHAPELAERAENHGLLRVWTTSSQVFLHEFVRNFLKEWANKRNSSQCGTNSYIRMVNVVFIFNGICPHVYQH